MDTSSDAEIDPPLISYWPALYAAIVLVVALVLALGGWAMAARLDAALVTSGVLHADSERKTVEHLEGGILAEVLVRPGDYITAGQVVARLDATQVREQLVQLEEERNTLLFTLWRLGAEQAGKPLDPALAPNEETGIASAARALLLAGALDLAKAREQAHQAQITALERQIDQLQNQIKAHRARKRAAETQLELRREESQMVENLISRGAAARARLWELERAMAVLEGDRDEESGLAQAAEEDIARAKADIAALDQSRIAEISSQLTETRTALASVNSRIRAAQDVLDRHLLRAPQDGYVVDLSTFTPGAVLPSGEALMTILPADDQLVALLHLPPSAIDNVSVGRPAEVRLSAYKRVDAPRLAGEVVFVSADLLEDPQSNESYYETRVVLDPDDVAALSDAKLIAGMPVEVIISIGERRAGDYLLEPVLRHLRHALREE